MNMILIRAKVEAENGVGAPSFNEDFGVIHIFLITRAMDGGFKFDILKEMILMSFLSVGFGEASAGSKAPVVRNVVEENDSFLTSSHVAHHSHDKFLKTLFSLGSFHPISPQGYKN